MINKASFTGDVFSEASFTWDVFNESFIKGGGKRKSGEMQKKWEKEKDVKELKKMWISSCLKHIFNNRINISINILSEICLLDVASSTKLTAWYG